MATSATSAPAIKNQTATVWMAAGIFVFLAALLFPFHGNRMVFTNDEGILLEPAQRMAQGAAPYVDFFGYMSPGSYWLQAAIFQLAGISLWAGRLPVILDLALQGALVFWLTARLSSRVAGLGALIAFTGFQIADPGFLTAQHRWDSATLALLGCCVLIQAQGKPSPGWLWASGILMGTAAWCTPSMGLAIAAALAWMAICRESWIRLTHFAGGVAVISAVGIALLAAQGALQAFFGQMAWLSRNYTGVNVMPYGSIIGGWAAALHDAHGFERVVFLLVLGCVELPAILPPVAIALWALTAWRGKLPNGESGTVTLALLSMTALVFTTFPRADVMHLAFVAALPYALTAAAVARLIPLRAGILAVPVMLLLPLLFSANYWNSWRATQTLATPIGQLRVPANERTGMEQMLARVGPAQSLFVYPYMPVFYFVSQASNRSRYSFLAPGMMTSREELEVLGELQKRPPEWLMYLQLSREEFLRVFPSGGNLDHRFSTLEQWLESNYAPLREPEIKVAGYQLWRRNKTEETAQAEDAARK